MSINHPFYSKVLSKHIYKGRVHDFGGGGGSAVQKANLALEYPKQVICPVYVWSWG